MTDEPFHLRAGAEHADRPSRAVWSETVEGLSPLTDPAVTEDQAEARRFALSMAVQAAEHGVPLDRITSAARAFHGFLTGTEQGLARQSVDLNIGPTPARQRTDVLGTGRLFDDLISGLYAYGVIPTTLMTPDKVVKAALEWIGARHERRDPDDQLRRGTFNATNAMYVPPSLSPFETAAVKRAISTLAAGLASRGLTGGALTAEGAVLRAFAVIDELQAAVHPGGVSG